MRFTHAGRAEQQNVAVLSQPSNDAQTTGDINLETALASPPQANHRETIRKETSEPEKRSAAAGAKKKAQQGQVA